ncbi:hypothetical protein [Thioalkalivibrio sp. ALE16]|uniref:hypothetical protein n=1 Tax=Thioalkalivibrio sp. ALE16 TaxID=1158172 RepID=UPI000362CA95|nr:hypothetical protein [Thioalkalivibrio sp. ALE16]
MLICSCDFDMEPGDIGWEYAPYLRPLARARATRCADCGDRITPGDDALTLHRFKIPETEIEVKIHGEDGAIGRAPHHLCDQCGTLLLGLMRKLGDRCCGFHYTQTRAATEDYHHQLRAETARGREAA